MPSLTDVYLTSEAFYYKNDVTITGSTHFIPLSRIDIGALQRFFSSSPAKTPSPSSSPSDDCCLILSPLCFNKQLTPSLPQYTTNPYATTPNNTTTLRITTPPLKRLLRKPHTTEIGHIYPSLHTTTLTLHQDVTRIRERLAFIPRPHHTEFGQVYSIKSPQQETTSQHQRARILVLSEPERVLSHFNPLQRGQI